MLGEVLQAWGYENTTENQHETRIKPTKHSKQHTQPPTTTQHLGEPSQLPLAPQKAPGRPKGCCCCPIFQEQHSEDFRKRQQHVPSSLVAFLVLGDFVRQSPFPQVLQVPHDGSFLHQGLHGAFEHGSSLRLGRKVIKVRNS